jgi:hypothetical protein
MKLIPLAVAFFAAATVGQVTVGYDSHYVDADVVPPSPAPRLRPRAGT